MIYSSNSIAVRHAYCRLGAGALAKRLSLVVRSPATAPRRSQDSQGTSSTSTCTHAPPVGRPPLSCAAVAGNDRSTSPDRTADGRKKRVRGAAANGKVAVVIKAPASFLEDGVLNVGRFLSRRLGLNWKVANGRFVKTNCRFLSYGKDRKTAKVAVNIYVTIDGRKRLVKRAVIWGKVRRATYAEFRMTGLKKALAAMGAVPNGPLELAGCSEDGRTLSVELQRVKAEQVGRPRCIIFTAHSRAAQRSTCCSRPIGGHRVAPGKHAACALVALLLHLEAGSAYVLVVCLKLLRC